MSLRAEKISPEGPFGKGPNKQPGPVIRYQPLVSVSDGRFNEAPQQHRGGRCWGFCWRREPECPGLARTVSNENMARWRVEVAPQSQNPGSLSFQTEEAVKRVWSVVAGSHRPTQCDDGPADVGKGVGRGPLGGRRWAGCPTKGDTPAWPWGLLIAQDQAS